MTLIIALGNSEQIIQVSDRRLTVNGQLQDDESNKAGVLITADARLTFGFTGLARAGSFATREWLNSILQQHEGRDFSAYNILEGLKERATRDFRTSPARRYIPRNHRALGIMFSGFTYLHSPPTAVYAILRNYSYFDSSAQPYVWEHFECTYWSERRPSTDDREISLVQKLGFWPAMNEEDVGTLRPLLIQRKPARAILGKAIEVLHAIADRPEACGTIGKQLSSIILPRDVKIPVTSDYHSNALTHTVYMPDFVVITEQGRATFTNASVEPVDPANTPPMAVPRVSRNSPCPCMSGKKYKRCHGRING